MTRADDIARLMTAAMTPRDNARLVDLSPDDIGALMQRAFRPRADPVAGTYRDTVTVHPQTKED